MAGRVAKIYGGTPIVNVFEIGDTFIFSAGLNVKNFGTETSVE